MGNQLAEYIPTVKIGDISIDPETGDTRDGEGLFLLSAPERLIMLYLMENLDQPVSENDLKEFLKEKIPGIKFKNPEDYVSDILKVLGKVSPQIHQHLKILKGRNFIYLSGEVYGQVTSLSALASNAAVTGDVPTSFSFENMVFDTRDNLLVGSRRYEALGRREGAILTHLLQNPEKLVSYSELADLLRSDISKQPNPVNIKKSRENLDAAIARVGFCRSLIINGEGITYTQQPIEFLPLPPPLKEMPLVDPSAAATKPSAMIIPMTEWRLAHSLSAPKTNLLDTHKVSNQECVDIVPAKVQQTKPPSDSDLLSTCDLFCEGRNAALLAALAERGVTTRKGLILWTQQNVCHSRVVGRILHNTLKRRTLPASNYIYAEGRIVCAALHDLAARGGRLSSTAEVVQANSTALSSAHIKTVGNDITNRKPKRLMLSDCLFFSGRNDLLAAFSEIGVRDRLGLLAWVRERGIKSNTASTYVANIIHRRDRQNPCRGSMLWNIYSGFDALEAAYIQAQRAKDQPTPCDVVISPTEDKAMESAQLAESEPKDSKIVDRSAGVYSRRQGKLEPGA